MDSCSERLSHSVKVTLFIFIVLISFPAEIGSTCFSPDLSSDCDMPVCFPGNLDIECDNVYSCRDRKTEEDVEMNASLVMLISTRFACNGTSGMYLIYGDPDVYLKEMANSRTSNTSYFEFGVDVQQPVMHSSGALDVNYGREHTYWSVNTRNYITSWPYLIPNLVILSFSYHRGPVSRKVTGLAVDWISNLLYWSDADYQLIGVMDTRGNRKWRTVVDTNLTSPQDVVIYPKQSYLFWSDVGSNPKIEMLDLAQDTRRVLVTSPTVQSPKTLVIDYASIRLFWLDTAKAEVSSVKFDGSDYSSWTSSLFSHISSFFLYKQYIVFGDESKFTVYFYNATTRQSIFNYTNEALQNISDIIMAEPTRQPDVLSPCKVKNGGCEQFCITINSTNRKCQCANGWFLADNGVNCTTKVLLDNFLLVADDHQQAIFQVDLNTGEVHGLIYDSSIYGTDLDFDPATNNIYWNDVYRHVHRTNLNTLETTRVVPYASYGVYRMAYDPPTELVYYIGGTIRNIEEITLSEPNWSTSRTFLRSDEGSRPEAILLDASNGLLYWSDCRKRTIERAELSNSNNRKTVVSSLRSCVVALAMDFQDEIIFWADKSGRIDSLKLDGSERTVLYHDNSTKITGIACDKSYLYFADYNNRYLQKIDRRTGQKLEPFTKYIFSAPFSILRYNSSDHPEARKILPTSNTPRGNPSVRPYDPSTTTKSGCSISKGCTDWSTRIITTILAVFLFRQTRAFATK